jgi:hypothetical protein
MVTEPRHARGFSLIPPPALGERGHRGLRGAGLSGAVAAFMMRRPAACKGCRRRDQTSSPPLRAALKGRTAWKLSRYLTLRSRFFCMDGLRGSPRIERLPSARGPNSIRPWSQPMASPSANALAVVSSISLRETVEKRAPTAVRRLSMSRWSNSGPR